MEEVKDSYEFKQYVDFVENTLIERVIPELLKRGTLDNKIACFHANEEFASFIEILPEQRKHKENPQERIYKTLEAFNQNLSSANKKYLEKQSSGQALSEKTPSMDVKEISHLFEEYSKRNHLGWGYIVLQHQGKAKDLYCAFLLIDKDAFHITDDVLDGLDKRGVKRKS